MDTVFTELDILAPFEIWDVPLNNGSYIKFFQPLVLQPTRMPHDPDEPGDVEYWEVIVPELNIDAYGSDWEELRDCVESCINFGWRHYVQPEDRCLNPQIRTIKRNYLAVAEEVIDG